ncbi:MAG TPA: hypothetical protein VNU26_17595 [Mycobacteriales bacterium]|nr:hypothetical protein [Mycobacteriales bacterium]
MTMLLGASVVAFTGTAGATHDHARAAGGERCVIIAEHGGEKNVVLPDSVFDNNPNASLQWKGNTARSHPIHVLVHKGKPGTDRDGDPTMWVYGAESDAHCSEYVNARP